MTNILDLNTRHPLVGIWKCCDGFSDIEIQIDFHDGKPDVAVSDKYDGEVPEVSDVRWSPEQNRLSFSTYWSSGRVVKYQFMPSPKTGRAGVTFSYVDHEIWERRES
ncbi:hypothetical protein OIN59_22400 [Acidovorax sp. D2M1]|uniref:Uncharacterized protein n=1 Tax=Acidovorax benzenivorans TaxID=2987520 RepID=A0ABT5S2M4_9BURK|nr:hypothetical protein [Acidovorax benzenivorans]MDD2180199.1 hypothetical protein [Acidovorax benzenivorans]